MTRETQASRPSGKRPRLRPRPSPSSSQKAARELKQTLAEAEVKQLAAWLDHKHKEVAADLKMLDITTRMTPTDTVTHARNLDTQELQVLGKRLEHNVTKPRQHSSDRSRWLSEAEGAEAHYMDAAVWLGKRTMHFEDSCSFGSETEVQGRPRGPTICSLESRIAAAAESHGYSTDQLLSFFLPLGLPRERRQAVVLPVDEVMEVLAVDLGMDVSAEDQTRLLKGFGCRDNRGGINVQALLNASHHNDVGVPEQRVGQHHDTYLRRQVQRLKRHVGAESAPRNQGSHRHIKHTAATRREEAAITIQRFTRKMLAKRGLQLVRHDKESPLRGLRPEVEKDQQIVRPIEAPNSVHDGVATDGDPARSGCHDGATEDRRLPASLVNPPQEHGRRDRGPTVELGELGASPHDPRSAPPGRSKDPSSLLEACNEEWRCLVPYADSMITSIASAGSAALETFARMLHELSTGFTVFVPAGAIRAALHSAGYHLQDRDVDFFILGIASDTHGRIDAAEALQAISDLIDEDGSHNNRCGFELAANHAFEAGFNVSSGCTAAPRTPDRSATARMTEAEAKVAVQLQRPSTSKLSGKELLSSFVQRDTFGDGVLPFEDFCDALRDLGLGVELADALELAFKYKSPVEAMHDETEGIAIDYGPFVRFMYDVVHDEHGPDRSDVEEDASWEQLKHTYGPTMPPDSNGDLHEDGHIDERSQVTPVTARVHFGDHKELEELSDFLRDLVTEQRDMEGWLRRVRRALWKVDVAGRGVVNQKGLLKALQGTLEAERSVGGKKIQELPSALMHSPSASSGHVAYPALLRVWDGVADCPHLHARALCGRLVSSVARAGQSPARWLYKFRLRVLELDKYRSGMVDASTLQNLLREVDTRGALGDATVQDLVEAFLTGVLEDVAYRPMLRSFAQHAGKWYHAVPEAATALLSFFSKSSPPQRFVCAMRRAFRELDTEADGWVDTDDVPYVLRKEGIRLRECHMQALLGALDVDGSCRVYYEDLVEFFDASRLPWYELVGEVVAKLYKDVSRTSEAGRKRFCVLRERLFNSDKYKTGGVRFKAFGDAIKRAGLRLGEQEVKKLAQALEVDMSSDSEDGDTVPMVQYRELLKYLLDQNNAALEDAVDEFALTVRRQLSDADGGLNVGLQRVMQACHAADSDGTGRISIDAFRRCLQKSGCKLSLEDAGHLADLSDWYGDGCIAYADLLRCVRPMGRRGDEARQGKDVWAWKSSHALLELRKKLSKLPKDEREKRVLRTFKELDEHGEGLIRAEDLEDLSMMLGLEDGDSRHATHLTTIAEDMYARSSGNGGGLGGGRHCIPYKELKEAILMTDAELRIKYPASVDRKARVGRLAEKLLSRKRTSVVGHRISPEAEEGDEVHDAETAFLSACRKLDRRRIGYLSPQQVRKMLNGRTEVSSEALRGAMEACMVGPGKVAYKKIWSLLTAEHASDHEEPSLEGSLSTRKAKSISKAHHQASKKARRDLMLKSRGL